MWARDGEALSFGIMSETGLGTKIVKWVKSLFHRVSDIYFWQRRVWSWLRTNAGGVPHTCKSNEKLPSGSRKWRTGEYNIGNLPLGGGQQRETSANTPYERSWNAILENSGAQGWVCIWLASWRCNGPPRRRSVAGLRGWSATMGLRHGPYSYGRQQ